MEVAVVYCKECVFSQNSESIIRGYFGKMNAADFDNAEVEVKFYDLREIEHPSIAVTIRRAPVKVILISHHFLQHLEEAVIKLSPFNRIFSSNGVIAVLVHIGREEILRNYGQLLPHFSVWNVLELRTSRGVDSQFCKVFIEQVIRCYSSGRRPQPPKLRIPGVQDQSPLSPPLEGPSKGPPFVPQVMENHLNGTLHVRERRLTIALGITVSSGDTIRVELKKSGLSGLFVANFRIPESVGERDDSFSIEIGANIGSAGRSDPHVQAITLESTIQRFPAYRKCLDEYVSEILSRHFRDGTSFESDPQFEMVLAIQSEKSNEFPTIMHLAVYYGLERSVMTLLEEGSGLEMCDIQNCNSQTPLQMAENMGFLLTIGKTIQDYKEVMVTWEALQYMKVLYETYSLRKPSTVNLTLLQSGPGIPVTNQAQQENRTSNNNTGFGNRPHSTGNATSDNSAQGNRLPRTSEGETGPSRFLPDVVIGTAEDSPPKIQLRRSSTSVMTRGLSRHDSGKIFTTHDKDPKSPKSANSTQINEEHYSCPPEPKPILPPKKTKLIEIPETKPIMLKKDGTIPKCTEGYILMNEHAEPHPKTSKSSASSLSSSEEDLAELPKTFDKIERRSKLELKIKSLTSEASSINFLLDEKSSSYMKKGCVLDPTDIELLEMMIAVKEKAIPLSKVEEYFANWKDRPDVKHHHSERQKELEKMREQYAEALARQGTSSGLPLFDRVIKLFGVTRHKKNSSPNPCSSPTIIDFFENTQDQPDQPCDPTSEIDATPPPLLRRKATESVPTEKVWGNAMSRKYAAASYITPSDFSASDRDSDVNDDEYENMGFTDTELAEPQQNVNTSFPDCSDDGREIKLTEVNTQEAMQINPSLTKESDELSELSDAFPVNPVIQSTTQIPNDNDISNTPPPIPPKTKSVCTSDTKEPTLPPRKYQGQALSFVNYERQGNVGDPKSPHYGNSPSTSAQATPTSPPANANISAGFKEYLREFGGGVSEELKINSNKHRNVIY